MRDDRDYTVDIRAMGEFSAHELYALLKLRVDVFVVEQRCAYPELDGKDAEATHLMLKREEDIVAAARIFPPHDDLPAKIGRVVVSPAHRGERLGEALMREALSHCHSTYPDAPVFLSAQSHLRRFYGSLGFEPISEEYVEDGIPHIDMLRRN